MAAGSRRHHAWLIVLALAVLVASAVTAVNAAETPRRGGILLAVIGADPPSLDPHQESTFATLQLVAPLYSTLLQTDPFDYPKIIGDAASEWKSSPDGLTYTFKIRPGIKFHDGAPLTAVDVKATYDKLLSPPAGTRSIRKNSYSAVTSVEAPDASTVVFKLKHPSASLLENLASPWNVIYPKKYLDRDPNYFMKHVVGSGPFKFKSYTPGSTFEGERNPDYFIKDRPYLNGYKFFISTETSVRAAAIRSGRAYIEFRYIPNAKLPYQDFAVFAIQEWRKIGIEAEHRPLETAAWFADGRDTGNFELIIGPTVEASDDPDMFLRRYTTGDAQNWGRFSDPVVDD